MNLFKLHYALILLLPLASLAVNAKDQPFSVEVIGPNPDAGFNYSYVIRVPKEPISKHRRFLVVEPNNTGADDNYQHHLAATRAFVEGSGIGPHVASQLNVALLVPVFPRTRSEWQNYTHALDRDTMLIKKGQSHRLDIQLLRMVEDARSRLKSNGVDVNEKFVLVGFSASGTFSNRFAFLHPESVVAVVSGAVNSFPMLPVSEVDGHRLDYPLGISDLSSISGNDFRQEAWKALPQMIFMGARDSNDAVKFDDGYSEEERQIIFKCVGEDMAERWSRSQEIYLEKQPNVSFRTYGQVGHGTDGLINGDIVNFVNIIMRRAAAKNEK